MRFIFLALFAAATCVSVRAQKNTVIDSVPAHKTSFSYVGIQANLLLQQFISFNSNTAINTNPYIFSYSKNNIKTGSGLALGTGFNVSENSSDDGVSSISVNNVNVTFRGGYEKKYLQTERFIPFWGVEFGAGVIYNKTTSRLNQSFNTNQVTVESTRLFVGPAIRGGLLVALSKNILLGTEFFIKSQISTKRTSGNSGAGFGSSFVPFDVGVSAPTALFLVFRY